MEKLPKQVYTSEFRQQAVAMITRDKLSVAEVSRRLAMSQKTLAKWVKRARDGQSAMVSSSSSSGGHRAVTDEQAEVSRLRRENAELRTLARHSKKVGGVFCQRVVARCAMIKQLRGEYPVRVLCRVLEVSRSGYHAWLVRPPAARALRRERLKLAIAAAHQRTRQTYLSVRVQHELRATGFGASRGVIKGLGRELGSTCVEQKKRFRVVTTDSKHSSPIAPNLLDRNFTVKRAGQVWSADITYVPTDEGWLYVAAIKDLFSGEIVGRACGERMTSELVISALRQADAPSECWIDSSFSEGVAICERRVSPPNSKLRDVCFDAPPR